eukprot:GHVN01003368.1.p1 GENE.GHVN01003368.1~~GHVN01003368.1.p1  ORF type:complete len:1143 (-),score=206.42 GHVN01003368.1:167-3478(-)
MENCVMPDITMKMVEAETQADKGTLSLTLNEFRRTPQGVRALELQLRCPDLLGCDIPSLKLLDPLQLSKPPKLDRLKVRSIVPADFYVECYACEAGDLAYDNDLHVGRLVTDHDLYYITKPNSGQVTAGLFNADDHFMGYPDKVHAPFVEPPLRVRDLNYGGPTPSDFKDLFRRKAGVFGGEDTGGGCCGNCCGGCCGAGDDDEPRANEELSDEDGENTQRKTLDDGIPPPLSQNEGVEQGEYRADYDSVTLGADWSKDDNSTNRMRLALKTWMRNVGHAVTFESEAAGSRILARLQLMRRRTEGDNVKASSAVVGTFNMLSIVARMEGEVVWVSPAIGNESGDRCERYFVEAGEVVMVLRGKYDKQDYAITIPSFDLRYPQMSGWYVLDTITSHFAETAKFSMEQEIHLLRMAQKAAPKNHHKEEMEKQLKEYTMKMLSLPSNQQYIIGEGGLEEEIDRCLNDTRLAVFTISGSLSHNQQRKMGYNDPLTVKRGMLVCRLMKVGIPALDRNQSELWYDNYMMLPSLNINRELQWGEEAKPVARLKGVVAIEEITEKEAKEELGVFGAISQVSDLLACPAPLPAPPVHGWVVENVIVHIYVLTGRQLANVDMFGKSDPYLKISIAGNDETSPKVFSNNTDPDFYEHFVVPVVVPGEARLTISVMDKAEAGEIDKLLSGDKLIGCVNLDLEERWLSLKQLQPTPEEAALTIRPHGSAILGAPATEGRSLAEYHKKNKPQKDKYGAQSEVTDDATSLKLPPLRPMPIEISPLTRGLGAEDIGATTGYLRYIIDMHSENDPYDSLNVSDLSVTEDFELRLTLWKVTDISVFKDNGQRNDLMVECRIRWTDYNLVKHYEVYRTDIHSFANREGHFNWRIINPLQLPVASLDCEFRLVDVDAFQEDELIYQPERLPLDSFARLQMIRAVADDPLLKPMDVIVEFDRPALDPSYAGWCHGFCCAPYEMCGCPKSCTRSGLGCCPLSYDDDPEAPDVAGCCKVGKRPPKRHARAPKSRPARLHLTVNFMPAALAKVYPVGEGRSAPRKMPEPRGRVAPGMMFRDPIGYLTIVVGKQTCLAIGIGVGAFCGLLILSLLAFFIAQIVIAAKI